MGLQDMPAQGRDRVLRHIQDMAAQDRVLCTRAIAFKHRSVQAQGSGGAGQVTSSLLEPAPNSCLVACIRTLPVLQDT